MVVGGQVYTGDLLGCIGSRDNDGALTVFVCAIIQIKLDPFSGRCIVPIFTLIAVRT